jgi:hypothetical protein
MRIVKGGLCLLRIGAFATIAFAVPSSAIAGSFLDNTLGEVKPEDRIPIANPKPAQLLFEFQSNGATNAKAQAFLHDRVVADVKASGLFSDVSDAPEADGAVLSVTINNVADLKSAESKGFTTGLTLGLASSTVADGYECTLAYLSGDPAATTITETANHVIYTTVGLFGSDPPNATRMKNVTEAVYVMTDQILAHALNDLAANSVFNPNAPPQKPIASSGPIAAALQQSPQASPLPQNQNAPASNQSASQP